MHAGGDVLVSATDEASIVAKVFLSAEVEGGGSGLAAGGVIARNDVRAGVKSDILALEIDTDGNFDVLASAETQIEAELSGEVTVAGEDTAGGTGGAASGTALNGLVASNMILLDVTAFIRDSLVESGGSLSLEAENQALIKAENSLSTDSTGAAVGLVLAFNTIGWKAQNVFSSALDTFIGGDSLGSAQPAAVLAEISGSIVKVAENLTVSAVTVAKVDAKIINELSATGSAAVGLVLASNLVNSSSKVLLRPGSGSETADDGDRVDFSVGGDVSIKASDTSGIASRIGATPTSSGGAALGAQLARNDVRSSVQLLHEAVKLRADGDVTMLARGSASIKALLTDKPIDPDDGLTDAAVALVKRLLPGGGTEDPGASMAFKGLIATNLVLSDVQLRILDSSIQAGGDLKAQARNAAKISAENYAKAQADGWAIGLTLAFNTIGWKSQNVLLNAIDALLGSDIGDEQPARIELDVSGSSLTAGGEIRLEALAAEDIESSIIPKFLVEERDACGVGFLADQYNRPSHRLVQQALT
ncbi:MAG: hypothetical protein ACKO8O_17870, partial [Betaproteobacteria bacterium]